jgi:hypothetical protein
VPPALRATLRRLHLRRLTLAEGAVSDPLRHRARGARAGASGFTASRHGGWQHRDHPGALASAAAPHPLDRVGQTLRFGELGERYKASRAELAWCRRSTERDSAEDEERGGRMDELASGPLRAPICVLYAGGRWVVKHEGDPTALASYERRGDAVSAGEELARAERVPLVVIGGVTEELI